MYKGYTQKIVACVHLHVILRVASFSLRLAAGQVALSSWVFYTVEYCYALRALHNITSRSSSSIVELDTAVEVFFLIGLEA